MTAVLGSAADLRDYLVSGYWVSVGSNAHHWSSGTINYELGNLDSTEQAMATAAMAAWAAVANVTFVSNNVSNAIHFNHNGTMVASTGGNWSPNSGGTLGTFSTATVDISSDWVTTYGSTAGSYGLQTYLHEIGHALGLGHQGPYNGSAVYSTDAIYTNDSFEESVMSYFDSDHNNRGSFTSYFDATPMSADIDAIQSIYGANTSGHNGSDTYVPANGLTIYDTGGTDTIDASAYSANQTINLGVGTQSSTNGWTHNVTLMSGTIENATSGSGADLIIGNSSANTLIGGDGNDTIDGGDGNDTITGGNGTDTVDYSSSTGAVTVSLAITTGQSTGAGTDTITGVENLTGSFLNDTLTGDSSANTINGSGGNDTLIGGAGADALNGGSGTDTADYSGSASSGMQLNLGAGGFAGDANGDTYSGIENITGSAQAESILGDSGANVLNGGGGNDLLWGQAGADTIDGGSGTDRVYYDTAGGAVSVSLTTGSCTGSDAQGDTLSNIENVTGSGFADSLIGSSGANAIDGGAGADYIAGANGADTVTGGSGADFFDFGFGGGIDIITDFTAGSDVARFNGYSGVTNFTQFSSHLSQVGSDVLFNYDASNQVTFQGVTLSNLHSSDFLFA